LNHTIQFQHLDGVTPFAYQMLPCDTITAA
jgi:hypothetical protein